METKIKTAEEIGKISEELKKQGKIIVTTSGCFDLLHTGHIYSFEKAKQLGDILIILLNSDSSVKGFKGDKRPIIPQEQRAKMLAALTLIDYVVIFDEDEPLRLIEIIKPHKHIKMGIPIQDRLEREIALMKSIGTERFQLPIEENISTTNIVEKILDVYSKPKNNNCL